MDTEISVMTQYELNQHLEGTEGIKCYASFESNNIRVAQCDESNTDKALVHESIHAVLTELFNEKLSFQFDRDLYYNFAICKHGIFKGTVIRESFLAILKDICFI